MKIAKSLLFTFLFSSSFLFSQNKEPQFTVKLLDNDRISKINLNENVFLDDFKKVIETLKSEFKDIPKEQKVSVLCVFHPKQNPSYSIFSSPKISPEKEKQVLEKLKTFNSNTKIVDFPLIINFNCGDKGEKVNEIEDFIDPIKKKYENYANAGLKTKLELNKKYAVEEVLPVLSQYEIMVEDKFAGVKNFGNLVQKTNYNLPQQINLQTSNNQDYWRATMEMSLGNQLIPVSKIAMLISQGEIDYATKYAQILRIFSDKESIATNYLDEILWRLNEFSKTQNEEIEKGIVEHDKGNFQNAIDIYNNILKINPNSSWALYERYYSQNSLNLKNNPKEDDRKFWDEQKIEIYKHDPLYNMDVRANNGKEAYLIFRRQEIGNLFKDKDKTLDDVYKFADISMDLNVYDFAAQLFWLSASHDKRNHEETLNKYLYCLEKLGVSNLKSNFKGDFTKIFAKIEKQKDEEMKNSSIYKSMKN